METQTSPEKIPQYERLWAGTNRVRGIIAMTHPMAVIVSSLMVILASLILFGGLPPVNLLLPMIFSMALIQTSIGLINEYCDRELDAQSKPWRAIPAGLISPRAALIAGIFFGAAGMGLASTLSIATFITFCLGYGIGLAYNTWFKRSPFSWLAHTIAYPSVILWVWISLNQFEPWNLLIYPLTFPLMIAVHLINQLPDYDTDAAHGIRSLIHILGKTTAIQTCFWSLIIGPLLLFLPPSIFQDPRRVALVGISILFHWVRMLPLIQAYYLKPHPEPLRQIFRRLKATGPFLILSWLIAIA
jgi:4-hydroxybenzoate polyprenyltransferase